MPLCMFMCVCVCVCMCICMCVCHCMCTCCDVLVFVCVCVCVCVCLCVCVCVTVCVCVSLCVLQVALTDTGQSRGFAFVDMASSKEAEEAQLRCNGAHLLGQAIRVSYGMPCRPGACILHQKSSTPVLPPLSVSLL